MKTDVETMYFKGFPILRRALLWLGLAPDKQAEMMTPDQTATPRPGRYRHYKGGEYEVIGVARHSETEQQLVVYRPLYGDRGLWVRPLAMFCENVEVSGRQVPRFDFVDDSA